VAYVYRAGGAGVPPDPAYHDRVGSRPAVGETGEYVGSGVALHRRREGERRAVPADRRGAARVRLRGERSGDRGLAEEPGHPQVLAKELGDVAPVLDLD